MARREGDFTGSREHRRVIDILRQPFKHQRPGHRAFHRAAHFLPGNRRARVEDGFRRHARHHVDSLVKANQHRVRLDNALQRLLVSGGNFLRQRGIGDAVQRIHHLHIALPRRRPVELGDGDVLLFQVIAEHGDADVNDVKRLGKQ